MRMQPAIAGTMLRVALLVLLGAPATASPGDREELQKQVSYAIPEGWVAKAIPDSFEKAVVGWMASEKDKGVSLQILFYTGFMKNFAAVRIIGLNTLSGAYPKGQEQLKKPTEVKTASGFKASWELWKGFLDAGGTTVALISPMAVVETDRGRVLIIGYAPPSAAETIEAEFLKVMNSVK